MAIGEGYYDGWVMANGVRTHYSWAGTEGPAVLLVHGGGPGSSGEAGWRFMLPALAEAGFRAYAVDQISMGLTDARPHAWPVLGHQSLVNHVRDFAETLCLEDLCVVGNSQGAYVSAKYAMDNPERVRKLFFIGSATISQAMGLPRPAGPNAALDALLNYDYTLESMRRFLAAIVYDPSKLTEDLIQVRHEAANRPGIRESKDTFDRYVRHMNEDPRLLQRFNMRETLPKLAIPARFIWGKQDSFAPVEMGYELAKLLPNIPFEYIEGAGHQCQTDKPDEVNRMVVEFFKG